jgi:hypothetical protein
LADRSISASSCEPSGTLPCQESSSFWSWEVAKEWDTPWYLLTNEPLWRVQEALRIVQIYSRRGLPRGGFALRRVSWAASIFGCASGRHISSSWRWSPWCLLFGCRFCKRKGPWCGSGSWSAGIIRRESELVRASNPCTACAGRSPACGKPFVPNSMIGPLGFLLGSRLVPRTPVLKVRGDSWNATFC